MQLDSEVVNAKWSQHKQQLNERRNEWFTAENTMHRRRSLYNKQDHAEDERSAEHTN